MAARTIGKPDLNRLRVRFEKDGRLAFLGHIEVLNTVMRSARRAQLPFSVGNGFARRMRVQFCQALPVGAASTCEYYDLYLTERIDAREALERLKAATPPALQPLDAAYVGGRYPALEAWLTRALWHVRLYGQGEGLSAASLDEALKSLQAIGSIDFMRGDTPRTIGLDTTLVGWEALDAPEFGDMTTISLTLDTRSSNLGSLRPAVLLEAAFKQPELAGCLLDSMQVLRMGQWHENEDGSFVGPLDPTLLV